MSPFVLANGRIETIRRRDPAGPNVETPEKHFFRVEFSGIFLGQAQTTNFVINDGHYECATMKMYAHFMTKKLRSTGEYFLKSFSTITL